MNRAMFLLVVTLTLISLDLNMTANASDTISVYFGTYTGGASRGIYRADFDLTAGKVSGLTLAGETENPSFIAKHPAKPVLYSVSEVRSGGERKGAALIAWNIDKATGKLSELGRIASGGDGPCHVSVNASGTYAALANYAGGSATLVKLDADGRPVSADTVKHQGGSKVVPSRQGEAHAHCTRFVPNSDLLLITDLGLDRVMIYRIDSDKLVPAAQAYAETAPGAGPRHMAFTPDSKWLLVINELGNTIASYAYDAASQKFSAASSASTLPSDFHGNNTTAEVCVHPNGKFVYGSNRGHDSIAVMQLDPQSGSLKVIEVVSARVKTPRNFNLIGDGRWIIAVGQDSSTGQVFQVDSASGRLKAVGEPFEVPKSCCVLSSGRGVPPVTGRP